MKISWGWKIAAVYIGFAVMIVCLVVASSKQNVDLVSTEYYKNEIAYQKVLDASKNEAQLAGAISVHANTEKVFISFPGEFGKKAITGNVLLYSAVNKNWDKDVAINTTNGELEIPRADLRHTVYTVKVSYAVDGKDFYYETNIDLNRS